MQSRRVLVLLCAVILSAVLVHADIYLHHPRGGNGRLNEGGRDRNNGDRLWDTQNNNRGGYNVGTFQRISYYQNTIVPIEWTQQHSCGNRDGNHCELIIQYTCGDPHVRDGSTTNTIPTDNTQCTGTNGDCDTDFTYGRHESQASYMACRYRSRNKGLFLGTQRMRGNSARFTRQNNNGGRSGYECPEERDYYPYWQPTIWRDIAIVTNRPERCAAFKAASQNVAPRSFCQWDPTDPAIATKISQTWQEGWVPITQAECESTTLQWPGGPINWPGGKWVQVPAFNIDPPDCVMAPLARDNHLGNAVPASDTPDAKTGGYTAQYNWTIPSSIASPYCVLRLRYNISTGEFPNAGFDSATTLDAGVGSSVNVIPYNVNNQDNNARYPAEYPLWLKYGLTRSDVNGSFTARVQNDDPNDDNNGGRLGGIRKSRPPSRDYTFRNNPQVDIFGDLLSKNISVAGGDVNYVGQPLIRVRLAINTAQFGRTFEDRSHVFEIRQRPASLLGAVIHNLSVRGKRGNIVQTYPGVEYDFVPDRLHINQGDLVHIQWTGTGASRDEDTGDKHNIVLQRDANYVEQGQEWNIGNLTAAGTPKYGHWGVAYPALINDTTRTNFLGLDFTHLRMLALWGINSSHFDIGPLQARVPGEFKYLCTRNNDFSNRAQKAMIRVAPNPAWVALGPAGIIEAPQTVSMTGETSTASGHAILKQAYFDARPDFAPPGMITIEDVRPTDPGGEGEQNWFKVLPPVMGLGVDDKSLYLEADRPSPANFFYKGQVMWKLNEDDTAMEVIPNSNFFATRNKFAVQNGGYYQSSSVPNSAMIAGVSLGVLGLIVIFIYLYWRVRVQPEGSWKIFCSSRGCNICGKPEAADVEGGGGAASEAAALVSPAAASSSSSSAVAMTPARV